MSLSSWWTTFAKRESQTAETYILISLKRPFQERSTSHQISLTTSHKAVAFTQKQQNLQQLSAYQAKTALALKRRHNSFSLLNVTQTSQWNLTQTRWLATAKTDFCNSQWLLQLVTNALCPDCFQLLKSKITRAAFSLNKDKTTWLRWKAVWVRVAQLAWLVVACCYLTLTTLQCKWIRARWESVNYWSNITIRRLMKSMFKNSPRLVNTKPLRSPKLSRTVFLATG